MNNILEKIYQGKHIDINQSIKIFKAIIKRKLSQEQLAAILISMKIIGESPEEIYGAVISILSDTKYFPSPNYLFADIVGTGGDGISSINISTASAIVSSCFGIKIIKHGNKKISGISGSSDILSTFKVNLNLSPTFSRKILDNLGICFLFAPKYHPSFSKTMKVRKILKTRTIFNILGPLINPAKPSITLIGVFSSKLILTIAETLCMLGCKHASIVHCGGMDEVSLHDVTYVTEVYKGIIKSYIINPNNFNLPLQKLKYLKIKSKEKNHEILTLLLQGKGDTFYKNIIAANVSLLLKLFGYENIKDNIIHILNKISNGTPYKRLIYIAIKG